jgi:LysM repeat protein
MIPPKPYVVKAHDSLAKIAHRNHVTLAAMRQTNNLTSDLLHVGQKLMIPATTGTAAKDAVAADKPVKTPAASHEPDRTLLGDSIPDAPTEKTVATTPHDDAVVAPAVSNHHIYTVMKGDTMSKIAHKFHMTTSTLVAANGAVDARKLHIGQKLHIPSQGPRSANIAPAPAPMSQPETTPKAQSEPAEIQPIATPSAQLANFMP